MLLSKALRGAADEGALSSRPFFPWLVVGIEKSNKGKMNVCKCAQGLAGMVCILIAVDCFGQALPLTVLHSFTGKPDGSYPLGLVMLGNTLYGTTLSGGSENSTFGEGTVFSVGSDGTGYTVLHTFSGGGTNLDGRIPFAGLLASGSTLYGTTIYGGANGNGTVFSISSNGVFTVLYNFTGGVNGFIPLGALVLSGDTLYGTTQYGGVYTNQYGGAVGTVFSVKTNGTDFTVLHSFTALSSTFPYANTDGGEPYGGLVLSGNSLYGTTSLGGSGGCGTVFAVNTDGTGFTVLHSFTPVNSTAPFINTDGASAQTALLLASNTLYGTTFVGGTNGWGTVFSINTNGTGFTVLHCFNGEDGAYPSTPLALSGTTLYGASSGGAKTVFSLNTDGTGFAVLSSVAYIGGFNPLGSLVVSSNTLYGTTSSGGPNVNGNRFGNGTVFSLQLPSSPVIAAGPESLTVTAGFSASFSVTVSGSPPFSYQWAFNGTNIDAATNAMFTLNNVFPANAGLYSVTISNIYDSVTSSPAMLTVAPLVLIVPKPIAGGRFEFGFNTASNVNYTIQYSTTLRDWLSIVTFSGYGGLITVIDFNSGDSSQRFYRVILSL